MFGFLRGPSGDDDYRRAYARCCRYQRLWFGARATPLLSYEGVFAYPLAREALEFPWLPASDPLCCRLRGSGKLAGADDANLGRAATAFGLLLASIKLNDDVRDDRSLVATLSLRLLRKPIRDARAYFAKIDGEAPERFDRVVNEHVTLERAMRGVSLADFAKPTATGFGYAFSLIAQSDEQLAPTTDAMTRVGRLVGPAIIAADCAADWRRDLRRGLPNPVSNAADAEAARSMAQRCLAEAGYAWAEVVGKPSLSLRVLRAGIARLNSGKFGQSDAQPARRRRAVWQAARAGDCDCFCSGAECVSCDGCGACGDGVCSGGCGDAAAGAGDVGGSSGLCDSSNWPCWSEVCGCCCDVETSQTSTSRKAVRGGGSFVGRTGNANGDLKPEGLVVINNRNYAAKTRGEFIAGGTRVRVVEDGDFGLVVEQAEVAV